jgi:hypothetical protein
MSEFKASGFRDEFGSGGPDLVGITTMTSPYYFVPPSGSTVERPQSPPPGMLRFNTDIGRLEVWRNDHWATILGESPNLGDQNNTNSTGGTGTRGVFAGGYSPGETNIIDYVTIETLGDAQDFGDLTAETEYPAGTSDRTRGLTLGGQTGSNAINTVSFVTIASTGDASDFGDLLNALRQKGALANSTRAIAVGGSPTSGPFDANTVMDYFTIQSAGNGVDFGNLSAKTNYGNPTASSVRGLFSGVSNPNGSVTTNAISYVTISTTGDTQDFGDLNFAGSGGGGLSNSTRSVIARDNNTALDFITIATTGNSQDFGSLTGNARYNTDAAASSPTRGLFMVGAPVGNTINQIAILSTGDAIDFGDLTRSNGGEASFSNGHGGL